MGEEEKKSWGAPKDERREDEGAKSPESGPMGTDHEHGHSGPMGTENKIEEEAASRVGDRLVGIISEADIRSDEGPVSGTVGGVTDTVGGVTDPVRGVTDKLLGGGGKEKQR